MMHHKKHAVTRRISPTNKQDCQNDPGHSLTRISHQLSAAASDPGMSTALRSVGLDLLSSTIAESSRRAPLFAVNAKKRQES